MKIMKLVKHLVLVIMIAVFLAVPTHAASLIRGTLTGGIFSSSRTVVGVGSLAMGVGPLCLGAFSQPVLTQVCIAGAGTLTVAPALPFTNLISTFFDSCTIYTPGIALAAGVDFVCNNQGLTPQANCTVVGVCTR